jgi:ABC-type Co2+ transport system permease subunit
MGNYNNPGFILRISIAIAYVLIGTSLFFIKNSTLFSNDIFRYAFAGLLTAYGVFRIYRAFQMYKDE